MGAGYYTDYRKHNELMQLRKRVEGFETGEIYQRITREYEQKLAIKDREIKKLTGRSHCSKKRTSFYLKNFFKVHYYVL